MTQAATRIPLDEAEPTTRAMTTDVARRRKGRVGQERINPMIWRRLVVPSGNTLADLHYAIQIAFAWTDYHLHRFRIRGK